jgi:hypothetical protein
MGYQRSTISRFDMAPVRHFFGFSRKNRAVALGDVSLPSFPFLGNCQDIFKMLKNDSRFCISMEATSILNAKCSRVTLSSFAITVCAAGPLGGGRGHIKIST